MFGQMFAEALMVLLLSAGGIPVGVHTDLSRVPSFVYTALVYLLREAIVVDMNKVNEVRRSSDSGQGAELWIFSPQALASARDCS